MLDKYKPPMNLAESERLLKAEADRLESAAMWKGFGIGLLKLIVYVIAIAIATALAVQFPAAGMVVTFFVVIYLLADTARTGRR